MGQMVGLVYCEGWDPVARTVVGGLDEERARERDFAGEQYAVCLVDPDSGAPTALLEIADRYRRCSWFDAAGRRERVRVDVVLHGRLFHLSSTEWVYGPDDGEFSDEVERTEVSHSPQGDRDLVKDLPDGGSYATEDEVPVETLYRRVPAFGDWHAYTGLDGTFVRRPAPPAPPGAEPPWRPPAPLQPRVGELFEPGARFVVDGSEFTIESHDVGPLRLPSGRLVAADPAWPADEEPFDDMLMPVAHPVRVLLAVCADKPDWKPVAALQLVLADVPAVTWEPARVEKSDPALLGEGEFYGAGVDSGQLCFVDASAAEALGDVVGEHEVDPDGAEHRTALLSDPASGGDMLLFTAPNGDGAYPTWVGRAADGSITCFVLDTLFAPERHFDGG
ncbi:DUF4241 domain-containing protein [Actinosynnema pretiosum subsp. pretiosum]|uniref:DUF4241 domain-containing protein n=1 Tax=Actinosynnema pretiosum subsp. pretiosum TaxID=103721 RepID=A0AA45L608_9PSEU|nr:DUF4241 domain-containing protein [Actinosynnema pretiosum subsp. pretiosum]